MKNTKVQWHLGFASAIDLELAKNRSDLTYASLYKSYGAAVDERMWLTTLSAGLEKQQLKKLLEKIEALDSKLDRELADSVLEVTVKANWQIVEELRGDDRMCQALLEIMEPEINKIKEAVKEEVTREVEEKERKKGIRSTVMALRGYGHGDMEIKEMLMKIYGIVANEAEGYL